jgi:hypothetical protein
MIGAEESVKKALMELGGKGTSTKIAKVLGHEISKSKSDPLKLLLKSMTEQKMVILNGSVYSLPDSVTAIVSATTKAPKPKAEPTKTRSSQSRIALTPDELVDALIALKKGRQYPADRTTIAKRIGLTATKDFTEQIARNVKDGVIVAAQAGKSPKYMLAGDDPRYAQKADEKLKFELLDEIQDLQAEIGRLSAIQDVESSSKADGSVAPAVNDRILRALVELAQKKKRRSVEIWALRAELNDLVPEILVEALERLGSERLIELVPVHDSTKLNQKQREGLLELSDGALIASAAIHEK